MALALGLSPLILRILDVIAIGDCLRRIIVLTLLHQRNADILQFHLAYIGLGKIGEGCICAADR